GSDAFAGRAGAGRRAADRAALVNFPDLDAEINRRRRPRPPPRRNRARRHSLRHLALPRANVGGRAAAQVRPLDALSQAGRPRLARRRARKRRERKRTLGGLTSSRSPLVVNETLPRK